MRPTYLSDSVPVVILLVRKMSLLVFFLFLMLYEFGVVIAVTVVFVATEEEEEEEEEEKSRRRRENKHKLISKNECISKHIVGSCFHGHSLKYYSTEFKIEIIPINTKAPEWRKPLFHKYIARSISNSIDNTL